MTLQLFGRAFLFVRAFASVFFCKRDPSTCRGCRQLPRSSQEYCHLLGTSGRGYNQPAQTIDHAINHVINHSLLNFAPDSLPSSHQRPVLPPAERMLLFWQLFGDLWILKWSPQSAGQCCQASPQCKPRAGGPSPHRSAGSCRTSTGRCGLARSRGRSQSQSEDFLKNGWQVWSTSEKGWGPMKFLEQGSVLAPSVAFQWNPQFLFASVPTQFNALSLFGLRVFRHIRSWVWKKWCWVFLIKLNKKCFVFNYLLSIFTQL